eukprot:UN02562
MKFLYFKQHQDVQTTSILVISPNSRYPTTTSQLNYYLYQWCFTTEISF